MGGGGRERGARRPGGWFAAATVCGALAFGAAPGPLPPLLILTALALATAGVVDQRPTGWGLRLGYALLLAYLVAWTLFQVETWRLTRHEAESSSRMATAKAERVADVLERRLVRDRELAARVAEGLAREAARAGPGMLQDPALFVALEQAVPPILPAGVGLEVYDPGGVLRAWWGDPRGEPLDPDSTRLPARRALVRRPPGYTLAYTAVPWVSTADTLQIVVKDVWAVESPLRREVADAGLILARLAEAEALAFRVDPVDGGAVARVVSEGFQLERFAAARRRSAERTLALLLLWPLLWTLAAGWRAVRHDPLWRDRLSPGWAAPVALALPAGFLLLLWLFLIETRFLALFLPVTWFSPLGYASTHFGPAGRSPGDFLLTAALGCFFAASAYSLLPVRLPAAPRGVGAAGGAAGIGISWLAVNAARPALEGAMQNMSPPVFFSPTLLFSPPFLMVLLAFALLGAVVVILLAAMFQLVGLPVRGRWVLGVSAAAAAAISLAAWRVPEAAMAGERFAILPWLAVALACAGYLAYAAAQLRSGAPGVRLVSVALGLGALVLLPLASYARAQAAHELLVERALRIGQASSQWLQYTMTRTVEYLAGEPAVAEGIASGSRDAALILWSRSPLRELDFASGLYLIDASGAVVSQFALTAEDMTARARELALATPSARIEVEGAPGERGLWWAIVPVAIPGTDGRLGTVVAMTTEALDLRDQSPGSAFVLTDLLAGSAVGPDVPGYTMLGAEEAPPPRTLLTSVRREGGAGIQLAMPLDPLLPGARGYAVFVLVGALVGAGIGVVERLGDPAARARWAAALKSQNPLRSFRVQLLLAFLTVAAVPLALYAALGYRATRAELEEATRVAAADALSAASRLLVDDPALVSGTTRALTEQLRTIADVLQQDLILYWRGRSVASSRPEIFASRLFADRMEGAVYAELYAVRHPLVYDATTLGERSFLVAYRALLEPGTPPGYVLATPLLIREDRVRVDLQRLGEGVFLLSALSLGFLIAIGWGLARFMARPLSALEQGTRQIAAGHLTYRLPPPGRRDEFGQLQRAFNTMAARLASSQTALEREKSRVQAILASVGAGVVALDGRGHIRLLNDRAADLLGQRPDEVLARTPAELAAAEGPAQPFWRAVERAFARGDRADRDLVLRRDGEERHYHLVCTALRDAEAEERGLVVAFEDITANVASQRVLAWGEMARQVAHEIKNPLTPMKLSLQHLERTVEDGAPDFEIVFRANLELVLAEIERLEKIAGNFARFAVPDPSARGPFDALAVARDVLALYSLGDEQVTYALETAGEPEPLLGDAEGYRRVLVNLLQNSREAVLAAGVGTIVLKLDWGREPGWAWSSVLDDGVGVPAEGLERLFEPSFSTKTRGTGLGLALTRRIVEAWGGTIQHERRAEGGTAMHVRLPSAASGTESA